jgi:hypothetical protein
MKKLHTRFALTVIVFFCAISFAWAPADNRRPFKIANVTMVKLVDNMVIVRQGKAPDGRLLVFEISPELLQSRGFERYAVGTQLRIQIHRNALVQVRLHGDTSDRIPLPR